MKKLKIPTFAQLLATYPRIAEMERAKSERPCPKTVGSVIIGVRRILDVLDPRAMDRPITWLTEERIDAFLTTSIRDGLAPISAWAYVLQLRGVAARWTRPYYAAQGMDVPAFRLPTWRRRQKRYVRPDRERLLRVKEWYEGLSVKADKREWLVATLMLEFAMRNGDVARLRWADFREKETCNYGAEKNDCCARCVVLCYMPHKTALTSGRIVAWPVHAEVWKGMCAAREAMPVHAGTHLEGMVVPGARRVFARLNRDLRARKLFGGSKGLYELRKICVDHVYQRFGAEMASSISGDDIRTVTRYYADPSAVNVEDVRIVDLL